MGVAVLFEACQVPDTPALIHKRIRLGYLATRTENSLMSVRFAILDLKKLLAGLLLRRP